MQTASTVRTATARTAGTAAARAMVIATRTRFLTPAAGARLAVRLVARVAGLATILVVRSRAPVVPGFAAMRRAVGFGRGNWFGGLDVGRLFRTRRGDGFAQLRKNFLEHDGS